MEILKEDRYKEIEDERSFFENLFGLLICSILNMFSKRKYKISDVIKKRDNKKDLVAKLQETQKDFKDAS